MARSALPQTEVLVTAECWQAEPEAEAVIHRAIEAAAEIADADTGDAELAVMLTDDRGIRTLNGNWRGIDKPTNVLSFPAQALAPPTAAQPVPLGDLVVCPLVVRTEALEQRKTLMAHWAHLIVHGTLHLMGLDHERGAREQARMERREIKVLRSLGYANPYVVPASRRA